MPLPKRELVTAGATAVGYLSREDLLSDFLPRCSVFAYPSRFDGLPLTLLEALASGLPCAVSDYFALPEITGDGGRVVPEDDPQALAGALLELLDPAVNQEVGDAALARYRNTYSPDVVLPELRRNYDLAVRSPRAPRGNRSGIGS